MPRILEHVERYTDNHTLPQTEAEATFLSVDGNHFCRQNNLGTLMGLPESGGGVWTGSKGCYLGGVFFATNISM